MITFRKLSAALAGKVPMRCFAGITPRPTHAFRFDPGEVLKSGERLPPC